jgi:hypothetical protein
VQQPANLDKIVDGIWPVVGIGDAYPKTPVITGNEIQEPMRLHF